MSNFSSCQDDSLSQNELVSKARELASYAAKTGDAKLAETARELEKSVTDYVHKGGRKARVFKEFNSLSELLSKPEYRKVVFIEFIITLMFELFRFLMHMHV